VSWPPRRTRQLGASIFVAGLLGAAVLYFVETRSAEIPEEQVLAGYARQRNHDMGVLYGRGGRDLMDALESANSPAGHAVLMIGAGAIGAWVCFHRAALVEDDERARRKP
jgi:hypothetical protein